MAEKRASSREVEPLRAAAGASEPLDQALARMARHEAALVPAVRRGGVCGILDRVTGESLARHGPPGLRVMDALAGGAPPAARPARGSSGWRGPRGTSPGLLVAGAGGAIRGVIARRRIATGLGPDLSALLRRHAGPEAYAVLKAASDLARRSGIALFLVGGSVRDVLLRRPAGDLDLVVEGDGIGFARRLGSALSARVVAHEAFGTAELRGQAIPVDVITARSESYDHPAALPRVRRGSIFDDLLRRDITVNAMAIGLTGAWRGRLRDELGGRDDLRAGLLRVHHMMSLIDDPTRAFRIARLAARLGMRPAEETLRALDLARRASSFERLSGPRLWTEFSRVAAEPDPAAALSWFDRLGLVPWLGPGLSWDRTARDAARRAGARKDANCLPLVLLLILARKASAWQRRAVARRLGLTGEAEELMTTAARRMRALSGRLSTATRPSLAARVCEVQPGAMLVLAEACGPAAARRAIASWRRRSEPSRLIRGRLLKDMGLPPGPEYRPILRRLEAAWEDGIVRDEAQMCALARRLVRRALTTPRHR